MLAGILLGSAGCSSSPQPGNNGSGGQAGAGAAGGGRDGGSDAGSDAAHDSTIGGAGGAAGRDGGTDTSGGAGGKTGTGAGGSTGTGDATGVGGTGVGGASGASGGAGSGAGGAPPPPCGNICGTSLAIEARHLIYDASRDRVYVSIQGGAARYPHTITAIDPQTAQVTASIPVGSDPNVLALSDDSSTLWVGIDGAFSMRKVTLAGATPMVGPLRMLPASASSAAVYARTLMALPDSQNTIAAAATVTLGSALAVYDDGVARPTGLTSPSSLARGPGETFFGATGSTLSVFTVTATGLTQTAFSNLIGADAASGMFHAQGRLYAGSDVIDVSNPSAPTHVGSLPFGGYIAAHSANRVLMLSVTQAPLSSPIWQLRLLDAQIFSQLGSVTVPAPLTGGQSSNEQIIDLTYLGGNTVALIAGSAGTGPFRLVLLHAAMLANDGATPDGGTDAGGGGGGGTGPGGSGGAGGGGAPEPTCAGCTLQRIDVPAFHMVYDPVQSRLYTVNTYDAAHDPNSLVSIDATTGTPLAVVAIDPNPREMALSDDGNTLWVGYDGATSIRKFSLASTPAAGAAYPLPMSAGTSDLVALPGSPTSIATCTGSGTSRVAILDDGVARPTTDASALFIDKLAAGPAGTLLGYDGASSGSTFASYAISASGVTLLSARQGLMDVFQNDIHYYQGRIYADWGEVIDVSNPALPVRAGKYAWNGLVTARSNHRVMMLTQGAGVDSLLLRILETDNFTQVAALAVGVGFSGTLAAADLVYIGGDGVAFLSPGNEAHHNVFIFRSAAIGAPP